MRSKLFCLAAILMLAAGVAWAEEIEIDWDWAGSYTDGSADINLDGTTANSYIVWAKGSPGKATISGLGEIVVLGPSEDCPYPLVDNVMLYSAYVARFENGDMLFARATTADEGCIDPVSGTVNAVVHYDIVGGTGRYAGATGSYDDTATWIFLVPSADPLNSVAFSAIFGHAEGFIYTVDD